MERLIVEHYSHPSIVIYVVFNEGWGQYEVTAVPVTTTFIFVVFNERWQCNDLYVVLATSVTRRHGLAALKKAFGTSWSWLFDLVTSVLHYCAVHSAG